MPEPFAGAVLPAGYAEAIASLNQREPAGDPAGAASSTAFAPAAAFIAACDVASQTVQSFVTSWAAASSAPAPPLSRSISPPRLTGGTSLGARGRIDATIPRRPASAPPTFNRGSLTLLTLAAAGAPSVHHQRFAAADFDIVASVAALAANASTADDPNPAAPSDTTTAVGGANVTSNSSASPAASAVRTIQVSLRVAPFTSPSRSPQQLLLLQSPQLSLRPSLPRLFPPMTSQPRLLLPTMSQASAAPPMMRPGPGPCPMISLPQSPNLRHRLRNLSRVSLSGGTPRRMMSRILPRVSPPMRQTSGTLNPPNKVTTSDPSSSVRQLLSVSQPLNGTASSRGSGGMTSQGVAAPCVPLLSQLVLCHRLRHP